MALFQYDALGRRVAKSLGGVLTRPVYAGPWIVEEQFTFNGVDWAFKAAYVHGPGVDNLVMMRHQDFFDVDGDSDFAELKNRKQPVHPRRRLRRSRRHPAAQLSRASRAASHSLGVSVSTGSPSAIRCSTSFK